MGQTMARYCPRCGTPTRADMVRCATCDLPVEAMLSRPGNRPFGTTNDATPQGAVAPTPRQRAQEGQYPSSMPSGQAQDFQTGWGAPAELTGPPHFSSVSPVPPEPGEWNASNHPGTQPWAPPAEPRFSPAPAPEIDEMDTWATPSFPPQNPPVQGPEMGEWGAPGFSGNPSSQAPEMGGWAAPNYPPNNPASQAPWAAQAESVLPPAQAFRPRGKRRAGVVFIILVVLLILAGGGYFAFSALGGHVPGMNASQATIKTTSLNEVVTYAGVDITLLKAQQAQNFIDDPHTASDGMLRLSLQEQNKTTVPASWDYSQSAQLIVQGKAPLAPTYVKAKGSIAAGATQTSEIDFAVANGGNLSQMVFQLGTAKEAQIQIPLNGQANLSQYQPKITKQNGTTVYFGLNWTLTGSTTSLSIAGQQASSGMEFLALNLTVDNTLSQETISGSPFEYLRVKAGGKTVAPISTTIPVSFASGATGKTGTATFLIPQNSTSCTLVMLSQDSGGSGQASINFKLG